ncbi:hypothetical protein [Candidatus Nitronereus thalassa]|uniref:Uncharacterized protein n=1 Tax=Candidatus Nitronereus thalassa TaxID=3020898 RepID=A0ABU3KB12_9BACT|nr:hypothetical protein [Candidatus Nitronereus thalassa]MDT7043608.1 hypothetical protein [Candidatus Nitronereus thalassa]
MPQSKKARTQYMCLLCGIFSETGPGFCAVNLHDFKQLKLNELKNGYAESFQKGYAHLSCLEQFIPSGESDENNCAVCRSVIHQPSTALKLAVYVYRKRGCYTVIPIHEKCFRKIKQEQFHLLR